MSHLFTYGTLMFPEVWRIVVGREFETRPAVLPGHQIFRIAGAVYPGIIKASPPPAAFPPPPSTGSHPTPPFVRGLVYLHLDFASLARLDRFEGENYRRLSVDITTDDDQTLSADTYIIPPEHRQLLTDEVWTAEEFANRGDLARFVAKYAGFDRLS